MPEADQQWGWASVGHTKSIEKRLLQQLWRVEGVPNPTARNMLSKELLRTLYLPVDIVEAKLTIRHGVTSFTNTPAGRFG
jgi:hypothetical protein